MKGVRVPPALAPAAHSTLLMPLSKKPPSTLLLTCAADTAVIQLKDFLLGLHDERIINTDLQANKRAVDCGAMQPISAYAHEARAAVHWPSVL